MLDDELNELNQPDLGNVGLFLCKGKFRQHPRTIRAGKGQLEWMEHFHADAVAADGQFAHFQQSQGIAQYSQRFKRQLSKRTSELGSGILLISRCKNAKMD